MTGSDTRPAADFEELDDLGTGRRQRTIKRPPRLSTGGHGARFTALDQRLVSPVSKSSSNSPRQPVQ